MRSAKFDRFSKDLQSERIIALLQVLRTFTNCPDIPKPIQRDEEVIASGSANDGRVKIVSNLKPDGVVVFGSSLQRRLRLKSARSSYALPCFDEGDCIDRLLIGNSERYGIRFDRRIWEQFSEEIEDVVPYFEKIAKAPIPIQRHVALLLFLHGVNEAKKNGYSGTLSETHANYLSTEDLNTIESKCDQMFRTLENRVNFSTYESSDRPEALRIDLSSEDSVFALCSFWSLGRCALEWIHRRVDDKCLDLILSLFPEEHKTSEGDDRRTAWCGLRTVFWPLLVECSRLQEGKAHFTKATIETMIRPSDDVFECFQRLVSLHSKYSEIELDKKIEVISHTLGRMLKELAEEHSILLPHLPQKLAANEKLSEQLTELASLEPPTEQEPGVVSDPLAEVTPEAFADPPAEVTPLVLPPEVTPEAFPKPLGKSPVAWVWQSLAEEEPDLVWNPPAEATHPELPAEVPEAFADPPAEVTPVAFSFPPAEMTSGWEWEPESRVKQGAEQEPRAHMGQEPGVHLDESESEAEVDLSQPLTDQPPVGIVAQLRARFEKLGADRVDYHLSENLERSEDKFYS